MSSLEAIAKSIQGADQLLIVAAAGLSISTSLPNNPYHSSADFKNHYPRLANDFGYRNCYETMGLAGDERVPASVKAAMGARHFLNMTENFPPTAGYDALRNLSSPIDPQNVFCWTSNVDRCFVRSGFPASRIYTSQGEMNRYQCTRCHLVWNCTEALHAIDAASGGDRLELQDMSLAHKCPKCGQRDKLFPNLRGGSWFIHAPYEKAQDELIRFMSRVVGSQGKKFTVVEVGVGPNTPIVTSIPASRFAIAAALNGANITYIRVNPDRRCEEYSSNPQQAFDAAVAQLRKKNVNDDSSPIGTFSYYLLDDTWEVLSEVEKASGIDNTKAFSTTGDLEPEVDAQPTFHNEFAAKYFESGVKMLHQLR